jgi:hypothetical protein
VHIQASGSVEIDSQPVSWTWRAVADVAVAAGQSLEEGARLCGERMLTAVAGSVVHQTSLDEAPADFSWQ